MSESAARQTTDGTADALRRVVRDVIAPLIEADGGELYLVSVSPDAITLHLRGRFSGCPGNALTVRQIIEPAILAIAPTTRVVVTWGGLLPSGAERIGHP